MALDIDTGRADVELIRAVRHGLRGLADPDRAPQMQTYMKSGMPYLGVRVPQVRALVRAEAARRPPGSTAELALDVRTLWDEAEFREERYAATALLGSPGARRLAEPGLLSLCEHLIVSGAWWDHVDEVSHRVGDLLRAFPAEIGPAVRRWQTAPDRWLRRSSIICQLGARTGTDLELLTGAIEASAGDTDFFLRKAIGWALREYARTDPDWVRAYVRTHRLSPLSTREALKHVSDRAD